MVYSGEIDGKTYTFGVSGRLYKSNVLIYDHQTQSLWSQLKDTAVAGPLAGSKLHKIPTQRTTWKRWLKKHPQTLVLSQKTGFKRDYDTDPYEGYYQALGLMFPVGDVRRDLKPKQMVLGVRIDGLAKAYPLDLLKHKKQNIKDRIGETKIQIILSEDGQVFEVKDGQSRKIATVFAYWFAWQAFYPQTLVYSD